MRILLIWDELPDEWSFVIFHEATKDDIDLFKKWHGKYINSGKDDNDEDEMNKYFYKADGKFRFEKRKELLTGQYFDLIVMMGFIL